MKSESHRSCKPVVAGRFAVCLLAFVLLASSFIATKNQNLWQILHGKASSLPHAPSRPSWPVSDALWRVVVAQYPRFPNRCSYSVCPVPSLTMPVSRSTSELPSSDVSFPQSKNKINQSFSPQCPDYFRFIHHDLAPWKKTKISKELLDAARTGNHEASFTVVIKSGRLFVDPIGNCYQTRAIFTIWGFLQLLKYYPGLVPDVELVFGCGDRPAIPRGNYTHSFPPPVFRYCTTLNHFDIPFPDWSYWGWPEVNIQPWELELQSIHRGSSRSTWRQRVPKAFWKGNTFMGDGTRMELVKCNRETADIQSQDWDKEVRSKFRHSKLSEQCKHRYKVYVEGIGWSVSLKYILACDSPVLLVQPKFLEFFSRGLIPRKHVWPVPPTSDMCPTIASAVEWGNMHMLEAMELGKQGSRFVMEEVSMARVYNYMLHLLREYANLLDFEPVPGAHLQELCADAFLCVAPPNEVPFYQSSMVHHPSESVPCFFDTLSSNSLDTS
ncbi:hypothetical protein GOP47_0025711 [Adiantum capillus-veneris]|uniref:Glycosyl transferase CAP10 domain-containing protein n=1 Tax=Adiantum capillus-veneris TaxID=13818 RepID=A0A9D4Z3T3_ADICA|nr:hypothetical protein GOP47_0025711 [Adiantum capillus-veneris]